MEQTSEGMPQPQNTLETLTQNLQTNTSVIKFAGPAIAALIQNEKPEVDRE